MKKIILILTVITTAAMQAQDKTIQPQISVSGEGKVKVIPDQAMISIAVETKGKESSKVKTENDRIIDKALKYLKSTKIEQKDIKTERVSLSPRHDYNKKEDYYVANQTINIFLRDLSQYETVMDGLIKAGVNRINYVTFQSSQLEKLKSEARVLAVKDAKRKAEDFAGALGQKVGKAIIISDNSQPIYNPPIYRNMMMADAKLEGEMASETLAVGEMEVNTNVSITFVLE